MKQETIERIIAENKAWVKHNFDFEAPELGLVEEVGEFCHQLLKAGQKIRVTSNDLRKDAAVDMAIFFFHLCWRYNYRPPASYHPLARTVKWHIGILAMFAGKIIATIEDHGSDIPFFLEGFWVNLCDVFHAEGWDMEESIVTIWDEVKKRDFRAYPGTGLPPEKEAGAPNHLFASGARVPSLCQHCGQVEGDSVHTMFSSPKI